MTREVARREIESLDYYLQNHTDDYSEESHTAMMMAISALSAEPIRPKGEWEQTRYRSIDQTGESYDDGIGFRCSNCANVFKVTSLARYNFCPNCGARMKGSE